MAGAPTPPTILAAFGFGAGGSYITTPIPFASQQPNPRASYTDGFPPQTVGSTATDPPDVRDFNGIFYSTTANIAAFSAGQFFQFNSSISTQNSGYAVGAIVVTSDNSGCWLNQTSGNTNNPDTSGAGSGWVPLAQYGLTAVTGLTNANVTLSALQAGKEIITLAGALTGNVQIIFPAWTDRWLIANNTSGAFTVTCKTSSGAGVVVPQGVSVLVYGDGTNLYFVGSSAAANTGAVANTLALRDSSAGLTAASFNVSSDARLKDDVHGITDALAKVMALRGVSFSFKGSNKRSLGLIAQEVRDVLPEVVSQDETTEYLSVAYANVVGVLVEAVKELALRLTELEKP